MPGSASHTFVGSRSSLLPQNTTSGSNQRLTLIEQPKREKRILIYSHDTFGLGNIRRMLAIAESLVARDSRTHVLVLSGSPMLHSFRISSRIDFIKLPCLTRDLEGRYLPRSLPMSRDAVLTMRGRLIQSAAEHFQPDLILIDKKPLGVGGELGALFDSLQNFDRRPAIALVLRDILDTPEVTQEIWRKHDYHGIIARHYDLVLVAGQPEVFDLGREYDFPDATRRKLRYCGYIFRHGINFRRTPAATPARLLVTVGGGGDGVRVIETLLMSLAQRSPGQPPLATKIITGPEMALDDREHLLRLAAGQPGIELDSFSSSIEDEIASADVVVSMGGYNTVCETLGAGKRAVVVPRIRPVAEQLIRAQRLARRQLLRWIHPDALTPQSMTRAIDAALASPPPEQTLDFFGLERIGYWVDQLTKKRTAAIAIPFDRQQQVTTRSHTAHA